MGGGRRRGGDGEGGAEGGGWVMGDGEGWGMGDGHLGQRLQSIRGAGVMLCMNMAEGGWQRVAVLGRGVVGERERGRGRGRSAGGCEVGCRMRNVG